MKKNKMMRLASVLLILTLLTTCAISGTFAKYTASATGTDTARVAKWSFEVSDADIVATDEFTFDLFKTVKDTAGADEGDVKAKNGTDRIIAPGTSGSFALVLENLSEVTAQYAIDYTVTNTSDIPIEFSVDNGANWTADLANVVASDATKLDPNTGTKTITVQWKWDYEVNEAGNTKDTALGKGGTATVTVAAVVTATQVD